VAPLIDPRLSGSGGPARRSPWQVDGTRHPAIMALGESIITIWRGFFGEPMAGLIRKARIGDVREIQKMLANYAQRGELLPRSLSELFDNLRDIFVYVEDSEPQIMGTCSMHICWEDLAEIRSLVVREPFRRQGIGRRLVEACVSEAVTLGLYRVFALTYQAQFFERLGFHQVDKATLPHKIWADCIKCVKFPECDETALVLEL
jgi:amino-acid N-acetyltransferase